MHVNMLTYISFKQVDKQVACLTASPVRFNFNFHFGLSYNLFKRFYKIKEKNK